MKEAVENDRTDFSIGEIAARQQGPRVMVLVEVGGQMQVNETSYLLRKLAELNYSEPWMDVLTEILRSIEYTSKPDNPQSCIVGFALYQTERHLKFSQRTHANVIGIHHLLKRLRILDENLFLKFYSIVLDPYVGTCYLYNEVLLGCELLKDGISSSKPGLWIDEKKLIEVRKLRSLL